MRSKIFLFGSTILLCYLGLDIAREAESDEDRGGGGGRFNNQSRIDLSKFSGKAADKKNRGASTTQDILGKSATLNIRPGAMLLC